MRERALAIAWVLLAVIFVAVLGYEVQKFLGLRSEGQKAQAERQRLTQAIRTTEEQIVAEMRTNTQVLQEMQWTSSGGDPAAFLNRVADLVRERRVHVLGIGGLERRATPQFSKSWHTMQIVAPYQELREIAARVEGEKGILEDMRIDVPPAGQGGAGGPREELQARFKMTALELTAEAKQVMDRALAASGGAPQATIPGGLALPVPTAVAQGEGQARDPFQFHGVRPKPTPARPSRGPAGSPAGGPFGGDDKPKEEVPMEVSGIVGFPGGFFAILNNQIVKVGDAVSGHRVEAISQREVRLRTPEGGPRTVPLKELTAAPPGPRR